MNRLRFEKDLKNRNRGENGNRAITPSPTLDNCPPARIIACVDNCLPDNCPLKNCFPGNCPLRQLAPGQLALNLFPPE